MGVGLNKSFDQFIKWQNSFETGIALINEQHREVQLFLNHWYNRLKEGREVGHLADFVRDKMEFLVGFAKGHLRFEAEMLKLLNREYGFPDEHYREHMQKHRWFMEFFLVPLLADLKKKHREQINPAILEDMAQQGLADTARWWYDHIRSPSPEEAPGPDHIYRLHLETLSAGDHLEIINRMTLFVARNPSDFWLLSHKSSKEALPR